MASQETCSSGVVPKKKANLLQREQVASNLNQERTADDGSGCVGHGGRPQGPIGCVGYPHGGGANIPYLVVEEEESVL
jgi:hypothetical protein